MEAYFVVLQLQGSEKLDFSTNRDQFFRSAYKLLRAGSAQIVSIRKDTGACEDVRTHISRCNNYKTYLLLTLPLTPEELISQSTIISKASKIVKEANHESLVDSDDTFQLIMADILDVKDIKVNEPEGIA